jgi:Tfp pilus assembly protein PilN
MAAVAVTFSVTVDMHARLHHWAERHEPYDPYRLLPLAAGAAFVGLAYLVVTRRRLRQEVAIRQEREDALTRALHEIEVLSGLLAVCASCKRIRNDGDEWEPIDVYLQRRGDSVSHGICPQCAHELYPDEFDVFDQQQAS